MAGRLAVALALLPLALGATWTYSSVERVVDLRTHVEEWTVRVTAKNGHSSTVDSHYIAIEPNVTSHVAWVAAGVDGGKALPVSRVEGGSDAAAAELKGAPAGTVFYKVTVPGGVKAGEKVKFRFTLSFLRRLAPWPLAIRQRDPQLVVYYGNSRFFTPYPSDKQSTRVRLGTSKVESYSRGGVCTKSNEELECGPFEGAAPFSHPEPSSPDLFVHFENNVPFVTMLSQVREIEVSHRGNIYVTDQFELKNTGAALKGEFSRQDYQQNQIKGNSFRSIVARLPAQATDIWYRDPIGNVSTSRVRRGPRRGDDLVMEVEPRYPMLGGWTADFTIGYNLPASAFLKVDASNPSKYLLDVPFGCPFADAVVDKYEVHVILPEHATGIEWSTPFDIDEEARDVRLTYLDLSGRPVLVLRRANVVKQHSQRFQVAYSFPAWASLQEPLMLVGTFLAVYVIAALVSRLNLTLTGDKQQGVSTLRSRREGSVGAAINRMIEQQAGLLAAYDALRAGDTAAATEANRQYSALRPIIEELYKAGDFQLTSCVQRLETAQRELRAAAHARASAENGDVKTGDYSSRVAEVGEILRELALL